MAEAELARFIDRFTVEYVRVYPHPIERVWRAVTDPTEFGVWFIAGRLDPRPGGAYHFGTPDGNFKGRVTEADPPRFIRFGGPKPGPGYFQYELAEVAGGTRLRFVQHFDPNEAFAETAGDPGGDLPGGPDTPWKPGFVGGWHEFFDALGDFIDGLAPGASLPPASSGRSWAAGWAGRPMPASSRPNRRPATPSTCGATNAGTS